MPKVTPVKIVSTFMYRLTKNDFKGGTPRGRVRRGRRETLV